MPRIRTIKPSLWRDKHLQACSVGARLLFIGLISHADDEGRFEAEVPLIRAAVFPFDDASGGDSGSIPGVYAELDVDGWLRELEAAGRTSEHPGLVRLYDVRGERFGDLPGWEKHQRISKPTPSQLPAFENRSRGQHTGRLPGVSDTPPLPVEEASGWDKEEEKERGVSGVGAKAPPPSSSRRSTVRRADGMKVWTAYLAHHPRAVLTDKRRGLIRARLAEGYEPERLVAAIDGNHLDPHCNGKNDRNQQYHSIELILRDAGKIEQYEAVLLASSPNGHAGPVADRQARAALERFLAIEAESGRAEAEDWLDSVHTPAVVDRVLQEVSA